MIVIYLSQIGSAQFFLPILKDKKIIKQSNFFILSSNQTSDYLNKHKIKNYKINKENFNTSEFLEKYNPSKIILSATINDKIEKDFIINSKKRNIKTFSFIDMWSNYFFRFFKNNRLILPDCILAIDSKAKKEMIIDKIPQNIIKIVGHPYFEELSNKNILMGNNNVFYSQPLNLNPNPKIVYPKNFFLNYYLQIFKKLNTKFTYMSLHPDELSSSINNKKKYNIYKSKDFEDLKNTKNAFGVYSTQLISAYILKRNVYVFGYPNQKYDPFPLSRWGYINKINNIYDFEKIYNNEFKFSTSFLNSFIDSKKNILNILFN